MGDGGGGGGKMLAGIKNTTLITGMPKGHAELQSIYVVSVVNYKPRNPEGFACFHKACIVQSETRCVLIFFFFFPLGFFL